MPGTGGKRKQVRRSLYVKQNKAYQSLLAVLIIAFIALAAVVINNTMMPTSKTWKDNLLIRMIIERRAPRN